MNNEILLLVLRLDSIAHLLTWQERVRVHLYMSGRAKTTTPNIIAMYEWIILTHWIAPEMRYGQDRLLYYENQKASWQPIEELTEIMKTIKIL